MEVSNGQAEETTATPGAIVVLPEGILRDLPPILAGAAPDQVEARVEKFFLSVAAIFEAWVARRSSRHTRAPTARM